VIHALVDITAAQPFAWRIATAIVFAACVIFFLVAAVVFASELCRGDRDDDDPPDDDGGGSRAAVDPHESLPAARARLDAALRAGPPVARVHGLPGDVAGMGSAAPPRFGHAAKGIERRPS
jgi:hypothetical protein